MSSEEDLFPVDISVGAVSTIERKTQIVTLKSGIEERNAVWANSRHSYDISTGIQESAHIDEIISFFEAHRGALRAFRFKDWTDYKSCWLDTDVTASDQIIGTGDGVTVDFQLTKTYSEGDYLYARKISKPVAETVLVAVNGTPTSALALDPTTGILTFDTAPGVDATITAGFEFDVPVRFNDDKLDITMETVGLGGSNSIILIEVKQ